MYMVSWTFLFSLLLAQTDALSLTGIVFDPGSKPAENAHVRLEPVAEQKTWETTTQPNGAFRFDKLSYGTYRLTVQKEGYFDVSTEVRLESSESVEFTLTAAERVRQDVDVIARPEPINPDSVSPQVTATNEVIQNIVYTGRRDFTNALALVPGVVRDNSGDLHIQGSRTDQVRYQLDGMHLTNAIAGGLAANY